MKNKKDNVIKLDEEILKQEETSKILENGIVGIKELLAPSSIDRSNPDFLVISNKYVRNFMMVGFPNIVAVGWMRELYDSNTDIDTIIHIEPQSTDKAISELTSKLTKVESELIQEREKGSIKNLSRLENQKEELYIQRAKLERKTERLFQVQIGVNLTCSSKKELDKETEKLAQSLRGAGVLLETSTLRQDEGYKSVLPIGKSYIPDRFRNFNSGGLVACFPFYNAELRHENGVFCGINLNTWTPVLIDFYDRSKFGNGNFNVIGKAGSGKTFFVSLLSLRSALNGIRTFIVDPEGEYEKITRVVGGGFVSISLESKDFINPFDIEPEDVVDASFKPTGEKTVNIADKVSDIVNLIAVMAKEISTDEISTLSEIIKNLYIKRGITTDPASLQVENPYFDEKTGIFYQTKDIKQMPRFTDFHDDLTEYARVNPSYLKLTNTLKMFKEGGMYGLFDCYTSESLKNLKDLPIITFDVSKLEDGILRPIGMYITLTFAWEKFIKRNQMCFKRIVCDEAWMLTKKGLSGVEYTSKFLENVARRVRKRNGGLLCASQNYTEFASSDCGAAVLTNAVANMFMQQDPTDIEALSAKFNLSDGESQFLTGADRGQMLIKLRTTSVVSEVAAFECEKVLIEKASV